jgi:hypothetical protein
MTSLLELYCPVDDFWQMFKPHWYRHLLAEGQMKRVRQAELSESEVMTIVIHFHQSHYRTFKAYYTEHVQVHLRAEFPHLVSYTRFVELMGRVLIPLSVYLRACFGVCTGISFVDSTALAVCANRRIARHRVFRGVAARGKSSLGWFYGFKLHIVTNDRGELLAVRLTPGNVDDRQPVPAMAQALFGKLFGDRGYLSQPLFEQLFEHGVQLITHLRKNMPNRLMPLQDKILLRRRNIIETVYDQLKNISQIEHSRHRSLLNCLVNLIAGLIAYCHQPKKPSLHLRPSEHAALALA